MLEQAAVPAFPGFATARWPLYRLGPRRLAPDTVSGGGAVRGGAVIVGGGVGHDGTVVVGMGVVFGLGCGLGHEGARVVGTGGAIGGDGVTAPVLGDRRAGGSSGNTSAGSECSTVGFHAVVEWQSAHVVGNRECPGNGLVS